MGNLREESESILETTLEDTGYFGLPIHITYPDGEQQIVYGQTNDNSRDEEGIWIGKKTATVRLSSLSQELDPSKPLHIRIPKTPSLTGTLVDYVCDRPLAHGKGLGIVTFHLTQVEQST